MFIWLFWAGTKARQLHQLEMLHIQFPQESTVSSLEKYTQRPEAGMSGKIHLPLLSSGNLSHLSAENIGQ